MGYYSRPIQAIRLHGNAVVEIRTSTHPSLTDEQADPETMRKAIDALRGFPPHFRGTAADANQFAERQRRLSGCEIKKTFLLVTMENGEEIRRIVNYPHRQECTKEAGA